MEGILPLLHAVNVSFLGVNAIDVGGDYVLDVYRGDLEHPETPGNKWHKLRYHLAEAKAQNASVIATFGGPFSNHLHAFGNALKPLSFKAIALVRGELQPRLTPTLRDLALQGGELWPTSRSDYRLAELSCVAEMINQRHKRVYWIHEGGGGQSGAMGCRDWARDIARFAGGYDAWVVSAGTGTTAAGLLACEDSPYVHVFSALKGAEEQQKDILQQALTLYSAQHHALNKPLAEKLNFHADSHEGGYAKYSPELDAFLRQFARHNTDCWLDPVYTGKSMFALVRAMRAGKWPYRKTLFIHTGGLQGWRGYSGVQNPFKEF